MISEQEIKLECLKLLVQSGVSEDRLEKVATSLLRWILTDYQPLPLNTDCKERANTSCPLFADLELAGKLRSST